MRLKPRSMHLFNRAFYSLLLSLALLSLFLLARSTLLSPYDRYVVTWFPVGVSFATGAELLAESYPGGARLCQQLSLSSIVLFFVSFIAVFLMLY